MIALRQLLVASFVALIAFASTTRGQVAPRQWPPTFQFVQVVPNVYAAIEPQNSTGLVHGNTVFVINDSDVFVLDANHTPAAARATIAQLREVTKKPVRTIMYSHWHNDHNLGASAFADAYPGRLRIISTDSTRDDLLHKLVEVAPTRGAEYYAKRSATYDSMLASGHDLAGRPITLATPWRRVLMTDAAKAFRSYYAPAAAAPHYLLPTETFADRMTLYDGSRELDLISLGRANTRSDGIVYLPKEQVVMTGDVLVYPVPFAPPAHTREWLTALHTLKALGAKHIVPGHGPVMHDYAYVDLLTATLTAIIDQATKGATDGLSLDDAKKRVDVEKFRLAFTHNDPVLEDDFAEFVSDVAEVTFNEAKAASTATAAIH